MYGRWEEGLASPRAWQITRVWKSLRAQLGIALTELGAAREEAAHKTSGEVRRRQRLDAADLATGEFSTFIDGLAKGALVVAGYHQHNRGEWRRRRHDGQEAEP